MNLTPQYSTLTGEVRSIPFGLYLHILLLLLFALLPSLTEANKFNYKLVTKKINKKQCLCYFKFQVLVYFLYPYYDKNKVYIRKIFSTIIVNSFQQSFEGFLIKIQINARVLFQQFLAFLFFSFPNFIALYKIKLVNF